MKSLENKIIHNLTPEILAPAGTRSAFLAAIAAKADAIYCGLKIFSARMGSINFTLAELESLVVLAHEKGIKTYITLNALLGTHDLSRALNTLAELENRIHPDGIIIQDLAWINLARQVGFSGEIHLSTLANISFTKGLQPARNNLGADRVVIPRELNIDEIKSFAREVPDGLGLEVFIHGALCYGVSGRCYWSSFLGGKSGLQGRCVQPCRRLYNQQDHKRAFFSCRDLSLDTLVKVLRTIPQIRAWKIEGRKKGPHYVYYTARAYRLLRDHGTDPTAKKTALALLEHALGRNTTHFNFLPQRPYQPFDPMEKTASGLLVGSVKGAGKKPYISPRLALLTNDKLRVGYETEPWHTIITVQRGVPRNGRFQLKFSSRKAPAKGTPIFLIDRREPALEKMIKDLDREIPPVKQEHAHSTENIIIWPRKFSKAISPTNVTIHRSMIRSSKATHGTGLWLSSKSISQMVRGEARNPWWWLPPVIWPETENEIQSLVEKTLGLGGTRFVLNMPWQTGLFPKRKRLELWAGPFCNIANPFAIQTALSMGFSGVIVSPELGKRDYLQLPTKSPLPLGIVESGLWPLCVSRILPDAITPEKPFSSPKGEQAWAVNHGTTYWLYPNWQIDLSPKRRELEQAGYRTFIHLAEPLPKGIHLKNRPGLWNWNIGIGKKPSDVRGL
jgi:U32 family peptidase